MRPVSLSLAALFVAAFSLGTLLEPWFQSWAGNRAGSADILKIALGDSRRLFAKHAYVKADAYFHSGYYPSIYDRRPQASQSHMTAEALSQEHDESACAFLGKSKDWIDAFSRHFYPSEHRHLGESHEAEHGSTAQHKETPGEEREMLPWLRLSASLDPEQVETYVVAAYWMRNRLGKVNESEQFLREGLRANPGNCDLLFEIGRIYYENRHDAGRARNVWELAVRNWRQKEAGKADANTFIYAQLLGQLATLEENQKNFEKAVEHVTALKAVSPNQSAIQKWIEELQKKADSSKRPE